MLFNSFEFLFAFLPIVCVVYFLLTRSVHHTAGRLWLALASFFFYGYWDLRYVPLLLGSVMFNFYAGKRARGSSLWLAAGILANLAALGYYKYTGFFLSSVGWNLPIPSIVLPLGISFFTFTQIAYLVDASTEKIPDYSFIDYALFVSYFPHLLAGPILHHAQMMPQFANPDRARFDADRFSAGISLLAAGLVKKILVADLVAPLATAGFQNASTLGFSAAWVAALAYTVQIYFDFSGYTDMARGASKILNIELPINFNSPYQARNLQDFWQRWHITLSRFLRDYVFFRVGGAKRDPGALYFATIATFTIAGLWHGANWTFVIWGLLNGLGIVLVRLMPVQLPVWLARPLTFLSVTLLWVWFRAANLTDAWAITRAMLSPGGSLALPVAGMLPLALLAAGLLFAWFAPNSQKLFDRPVLAPAWRVALGLLTAYSIASLQNASQFLYFNF
jgi:alginate O-acetyltransferase complex protein AlgI